jgi:Flp pilus assembly protein TadB
MIELAALGLSLLALVLALVGVFGSRRSKRESEARIATLQEQLESLRKQMMELHTGAIGMGQRLQSAEGAMQKIHDSQQELTLQDPDRRLYSRAAKMVELGADLDEVMSECELPQAEAELLISLRKGRS